MLIYMKSKILIIGAGSVGSTIAYALMIRGSARNIHILDMNEKKAMGEVLDLNHGRPFVNPVEISLGSYADCSDSDIIIITAGAKQNPGETRIELLNKNIKVIKTISDSINSNLRDNQPIVLIISNPVDILTYFSQKFIKLPKTKIFGSGTVLDTSRLRFEISNLLNIDARSVHGYVIGEHGDSEVFLWSSLKIGSINLEDYCVQTGLSCYDDVQKKIAESVKNAAYYLIDAKGFTNYGIGLATARIVDAIVGNQIQSYQFQGFLEGQYGLSDVVLSIPSIIGSHGIVKNA